MTKLKHPKQKGTRFEKEVVEFFNVYVNNKATRMWGSNGASRGLPEEVDIVIKNNNRGKNMHIQCKSVAKLAQKFKPTSNVDAVIFKENHGEKYILLSLETFFKKFYLDN